MKTDSATAASKPPCDHPFSAKLAALQSFVLLATLAVAAILAIFEARSLANAMRIARDVEESRRTIERREGRIIVLAKDVHDQLQGFRAEAAQYHEALAGRSVEQSYLRSPGETH